MNQEELEELTGYAHAAAIRRCLEGQGVRVFTGKDNRVFILPAKYLSPSTEDDEATKVEFETS